MIHLYWLELLLGIVFILTGVASILILLYIGKKRIRELDRVAFGHELPNDSFISLMFRVPNYTLAFIWPFYAKRAGLLEIHSQFDKKFKRPFIINMWLIIASICALIIGINLQNYIHQ